jgi:hypothetical protein
MHNPILRNRNSLKTQTSATRTASIRRKSVGSYSSIKRKRKSHGTNSSLSASISNAQRGPNNTLVVETLGKDSVCCHCKHKINIPPKVH